MAKITFDSIAGGELAERFKIALAQVGRNILDPNMDPEAKRGITINLSFVPGDTGGINVGGKTFSEIVSGSIYAQRYRACGM